MYTDTKNLVNAVSTAELAHARAHDVKSRNRLRSLWRLITLRKDAKRRSTATATAHPNNVNLNNNAHVQQPQPQQPAKEAVYELTTTQLEDYIASLRKMVPELIVDCEGTSTKASALDPIADGQKVISSASIEKSPHSHVNCAYGRNCQHNHSTIHSMDVGTTGLLDSLRVPVIELPPADDQLDQLPVHYLHTDDGTFFWTLTQDRTDDDLLNAWLCNTRQQFPAQAFQHY